MLRGHRNSAQLFGLVSMALGICSCVVLVVVIVVDFYCLFHFPAVNCWLYGGVTSFVNLNLTLNAMELGELCKLSVCPSVFCESCVFVPFCCITLFESSYERTVMSGTSIDIAVH